MRVAGIELGELRHQFRVEVDQAGQPLRVELAERAGRDEPLQEVCAHDHDVVAERPASNLVSSISWLSKDVVVDLDAGRCLELREDARGDVIAPVVDVDDLRAPRRGILRLAGRFVSDGRAIAASDPEDGHQDRQEVRHLRMTEFSPGPWADQGRLVATAVHVKRGSPGNRPPGYVYPPLGSPWSSCRIVATRGSGPARRVDGAMSHKHEQLLRTIFHDPVSCNIHWREIESLLSHVGADIEQLSGARIRVKLNGVEGILHRPHHGNTLDRSAVRHLREYLAHARMTPSQYEQTRLAEH